MRGESPENGAEPSIEPLELNAPASLPPKPASRRTTHADRQPLCPPSECHGGIHGRIQEVLSNPVASRRLTRLAGERSAARPARPDLDIHGCWPGWPAIDAPWAPADRNGPLGGSAATISPVSPIPLARPLPSRTDRNAGNRHYCPLIPGGNAFMSKENAGCSRRGLLARISHRYAKRGRGDAGKDKARDSSGAQAYSTVRRPIRRYIRIRSRESVRYAG